MSKARLLSMDLGNGYGKGLDGNDHPVILPHAIHQLTPREFEEALTRSNGRLNEDYIQIDESFWVTGESVYRHNPSPVLLRGARRYVPEYYGIMAMSMVARMYPYAQESRPLKIMASYAPGDFSYRKNLKRAIPETFTITGFTKPDPQSWSFEVASITVIEEGLGAFFQAILKHDGKGFMVKNENARYLVVDLGSKTCEMLGMDDLAPVYSQYKSIEMGIADIEKELKRDLEASFAEQLRGARLSTRDIRQAMSEYKLLMYGKNVDVRAYVDAVVNKFLAELIRVYNQDYDGGRAYNTIILAGGGAKLLYQHRKLLAHDNIVTAHEDIDQCIYANSLGMNKYRRFMDAQNIR